MSQRNDEDWKPDLLRFPIANGFRPELAERIARAVRNQSRRPRRKAHTHWVIPLIACAVLAVLLPTSYHFFQASDSPKQTPGTTPAPAPAPTDSAPDPLVPAESFAVQGSQVNWSEATSTLTINTAHSVLQAQRSALEQALDLMTPDVVANLFGQSIVTRNGALQFALLSPDLRASRLAQYQTRGWQLATWPGQKTATSFEIADTHYNKGLVIYTLRFQSENQIHEIRIQVALQHDRWCIRDTGSYGT